MDMFSALRGESGLDLIEYAFLAGCMGLASIAVLTGFAAKSEVALATVGHSVTEASRAAQSSPARR